MSEGVCALLTKREERNREIVIKMAIYGEIQTDREIDKNRDPDKETN